MHSRQAELGSSEDRSSVDFFRNVYGAVNPTLTSTLVSAVDSSLAGHIRSIRENGITKLTGLYTPGHIESMQADVAEWMATKRWNRDMHMSFDGNSGEAYMPQSEALSKAITDPAILTIITATFGQHPRMNFVRTYATGPIEHYERRAFAWHHDGYSEVGLKAMLLLTDVKPDGQGMKFAAGTHLRDWQTSSSRETQFSNEFAESFEQYICCGQAGDVLIFNPHAVHRGERNTTETRVVTVTNWQPGIARNYPLPGLHPNVLNSLDDYHKEVFGVGRYDFTDPSLLTPDTFQDLLREYRAYMDQAFAAHKIPIDYIRAKLPSVDPQIKQIADKNRRIFPSVPRFIENLSPEAIKQRMALNAEKIDRYQARPLAEEDVQNLKKAAAQEWHADIEGDLDLPVRMYDPNRDQRRDSAITQTRDNKDAPHFAALTQDFEAITSQSLFNTNLQEFPQAADSLTDILTSLGKSSNSNLSREIDSYTCFVQDIREMLSRAFSQPLMRRVLLFNHLMWIRTQNLLNQIPDINPHTLNILQETRVKSANLYVKAVGFDKYAAKL